MRTKEPTPAERAGLAIHEANEVIVRCTEALEGIRERFGMAVLSRVAELRAKDKQRLDLAGRAMQGILAAHETPDAAYCFELADAMLAKAREIENEKNEDNDRLGTG